MKFRLIIVALVALAAVVTVSAQNAVKIPNPAIDMKGYLNLSSGSKLQDNL